MRKKTSILINKVVDGNKNKKRKMKKFYTRLPHIEKREFNKEMISFLSISESSKK